LSIGRNAAGIVVGNHGDDARSNRGKEKERSPPKPDQSVNAFADPHSSGMLSQQTSSDKENY
jgi:hypothetical protein